MAQLQNGPSYAVAFSVATVSALTTAYVLAFLIAATGRVTLIRGIKIAFLVWLAFVCSVLATQYTFEARTLGYFAVTAGYPLMGFLIMGAIIGGWPSSANFQRGQSSDTELGGKS